MSRLRFFLASAIVLSLASSATRAETFSSKEGRFTVDIPVKPNLQKSNVPTPSGPLETFMYVSEVADGGYFVAYFDLPDGVPPDERVDAILDGGVGGMVSNTKGKLIQSDVIKVAGFPARDATWSLPINNVPMKGRARLILVGGRMYQIFVLGKETFIGEKSSTDFVTSLKFAPAAGVKPPAPADPAAKAAKGPVTTTSKDGRFTVTMPIKPTFKKSVVQTAAGPMDTFIYTAETAEGTYSVGYFDLPGGVPDNDRTDAVLDGAINGMVGNTQGKLISSDSVTIAGCPARDALWTLPINNVEMQGRAQVILAGQRMYQVFVLGEESFVKSKQVANYLKGFKFDRN